MKYITLDTIPYKLFVQIANEGDVSLLDEDEKDITLLGEIWQKMYNEHLYRNQSSESKKIFKISKDIDSLLAINKVLLMACESLRFQYNNELHELVRSYGFNLNLDDTELYYQDIERMEREANAFIVKAERYKSMIPLPKKNQKEKHSYSIDDVLASYCAILGFNIGDFNTISYNAYHGYEKQVKNKIENLNKQTNGK